MEVILSDGSRVRCEDRSFAQGAQGEIYWSEGKTHVIKLYLNIDPKGQQLLQQTLDNILGRYNLVKEDPSRLPFFAWPDAIVRAPRPGIRMPAVRDAKPLENYVRPRFWKTLPSAEKGTWSARLSIAYRMARIVRWMHNRGLCHSDLSYKNFMVNVNTGQTTLIDCDGLVVPGIQPASVLGTPWCMAPEIVTGKAMPTINTDKHALAILIYWTFFLRNPLVGPKNHDPDPEKDEQLAQGARALYIEHPSDRSNRPDPLPFTSELLTPRVRSLFHRVFVEGLHNPAKRPSAAEWEAALVRMADQMIPCSNPACLMKHYVVSDAHSFTCPWCKTPYKGSATLPVIRLYRPAGRRGTYTPDEWFVVGLPNRQISLHHADTQKSPDPGVPPTRVGHFELDKGKWYLVNEGLDVVRVLETTGTSLIKRGSRFELSPDTRILLGHEEKFRAGRVEMLRTS